MAIIGIDLGTSNSAAAVLRGGRPVIIPSAEGISIGGKAFPSYVALTSDGQVLVGEPARRQMAANAEGTVTAFKRRMGKRETIRLRNRDYTPEQLSAFLLQKIKRDAEAFLGESVEKVVVTVPAYFDDNQRAATKDACHIAGLEVARLVNEPTAASLAYGLDRLSQELRIVVIDFGGGTLDVTIMEFGKGVFEVKSTSGDTQLGGTDMNQSIFEHLAGRFQMATGVDVRGDRKAATRLIEAANASCYEAEKMLANFADKLTDDLKKRIEASLRETKEAFIKKEVALATERAETLKKLLKEAGATLYAQSGQAPKGRGRPYAETRWEGPEPPPDVHAASGEPCPSGSGPQGKVVDAEYHENK
jgi:molecular chaperone DnaK (HSP70)